MNYNENRNLVVTNNLGFHDRERQFTNENYRILVLGDSFVEGRQVKTETLFTSLLEEKLAGGKEKIEVIQLILLYCTALNKQFIRSYNLYDSL